MNIDTNNLVSITEANQNFSKIARMVDENGSVVSIFIRNTSFSYYYNKKIGLIQPILCDKKVLIET